jgi:DNA-binding CsgD family transcriptional regulator
MAVYGCVVNAEGGSGLPHAMAAAILNLIWHTIRRVAGSAPMSILRAHTILCPLLVGRERELALLDQVLGAARDGRGSMVRIMGEAGVGKSRLVGEIQQRAEQQGFEVLRGRCFEPDRALPYAGLTDLLRAQVGGRMPAEVAHALGPMAPHLIRLLPEQALLTPELVSAPLGDPAQERQRLIQAFLRLFATRADSTPLVLVIEDIHWCDETTLDVLHALARGVAAWPLLCLVTYRSDEVGPALAGLSAALDRDRLADELQLARLEYGQADAMLRAIFNQQRPIRGDFLSELYRLTEGNPFFIEEVLTALVAAGDIFVANGAWERKPLADLNIPRTIQAAVDRRVRNLSSAAQQLVHLAAVVGRRFDFELLRRLTGLEEATLLGQIKELIAAQLVVEESADQFTFRHALTRAALEADLLVRERRALHVSIANILEALAAERGARALDDWCFDLAHHTYAAESWVRAEQYARLAAERSRQLDAPSAAIEHLDRAIFALERRGLAPSADLLRSRGRMRDIHGASAAALEDYHAALAQARATGDQREQWQALLSIGFHYAASDYALMGEYLRQALELARRLEDPVMLGQSLNRYGNWFLFSEQPREALRYHHEALALFQAANDRAGLASTYDLLGVTNLMSEDKLAAVAHYRRAIALFRELGDRVGLSSALATVALRGPSYYHMTTVFDADSYAARVGDAEEALEIARQIGWRSGEANALVYLALTHGMAGEYARSLDRAERAWELAQQIGHPVWLAGAAMAQGAVALDLLNYGQARDLLERALAIASTLGDFLTRRVVGYLALVCIAQRDYTRARALLAPLLAPATPMQTQGQRLDWLARAHLALATGDAALACEIADRLIETATHAAEQGPGCIPILWQLRGDALAALGQNEAAEEALLAALSGAERLQLPPTRWRIHVSLGRLYQAQGRRTRARQSYAAASTSIDSLAAALPDDVQQAAFRRAAGVLLPRQSADHQAPPHPAAGMLTRREREVAMLIAQGQTNREIAERLVLGERTIETHIGNILGKLGFSSRRQITAWAIEQGLVRRVE